MKLSIIIPIYNVEKYLKKCLKSVIYPELNDYEIILVNDGSTDGSLGIAESFCSEHPGLIRIISQENGGLGAARNTGIEAAYGDYLLFLDSDDYLSSDALPQIFSRLDEDFDMCLFGILSINETGEKVNDIPLCSKSGTFSLRTYPELLLSAHSACNKIFRRSLFTETGIRFPGRVWYEDMRTIPKLYLYSERVVTDPRNWYIYLQRSGSITNNADLEKNLQIIDAVDDLIGYYKEQGEFENYKAELEYSAFYNEFLTASVRVCLADPESPVLSALRDDFLRRFPDYRSNKYIQQMPLRHRLLTLLLMNGMTSCAKHIMLLNNRLKNKTA